MKKLILIAAVIIMAVTTYGQTVKKGTVLCPHVSTITLNQGVTMDQYVDFCKSKLIPAYEKNFPGIRCYLAKGIKGEYIDTYSMIVFWKSKAEMEKYFKQDGSTTETGKAAMDKMKPVVDEWRNLAKIVDKYTDWELQ